MKRYREKYFKKNWSLIGGIAGLVLGFYLIFIIKNNWGFVFTIMGALLLIIKRNDG
jgi:membrane-bound ClpP family serine protease